MTETDFHSFAAEGIRVSVDLRGGHVRQLQVEQGGRTIEPIHTAPWVEDAAIAGDEAIVPNLRFLSGDFFCAPFGFTEPGEGPPHGWPANSRWRLLGVETIAAGGRVARYELAHDVAGARLIKEFTLRDGHPFLYQRHIFFGGEGPIPVANHGMTRFDAPGRISFSPKLYGMTPANSLEPDPAIGRSVLAYPARFDDPARVPLADGTSVDITAYPFASRHEDFVMMIEDPANPLGWATAARPDKGDIFVSLKSPADYPVTMFWFSNGGRDYAPWNGRHVGVLGIEEGRTYAGMGRAASIAPNPLNEAGIATTLDLVPNGEASVRNVIGGLPLPEGWTRVAQVEASDGVLTLRNDQGEHVSVPFDTGFLA
ncbi:hypothetical protein OSH11_18685 [Kaistia dalseonensis]|uniref:Glucose-6-phosphate 1-epimerase n=1 Tax=Kaistia dalseonensis TaxID=410840 RepID=A0ABU0HAM2_9HYPH|nr:hypothetical protein [Kaistia dalseonensis]MCX5496740.1 hypothetical protein [Kaistia dalseonensis]MDQ0439366.1 hypothetical protein [Kaistia dalseonensis]